MKLYLMRHGPAEDHADSGLDGDRALTAAGRERVRAVAKAIAEYGEEPISILTSPLVRAVQTAEIVAAVLRVSQRGGVVEVRREMSPSGDGLGLVNSLLEHRRKRTMLVGHEPDLTEMALSLLGSGAFQRPFEKAMVLGLHVARLPRSAEQGHHGDARHRTRLRFVLDPKALRLDPDSRALLRP